DMYEQVGQIMSHCSASWFCPAGCLQLTHLLTAESVRMVAMGDRMFFRSHTLTVRSSLPDTTLSPTVKTADVTVLQRTRKQVGFNSWKSRNSLNSLQGQFYFRHLQDCYMSSMMYTMFSIFLAFLFKLINLIS
ncbi:hypothetical protein GOODEAATRI_022815, partial [Goodea atripinnis]